MEHTIINIGRQFGAGGLQVAEAIGEKLGIPVYDKALISKAAEKSGFSEEFFERRDEKRGFRLFQNVLSAGRTNTQNYINDDALFRMQSSVIRDLAENGPAVFVGRASNYVLRDMPCLDVFICAPLSSRIERVAERRGISAAEAEALIDKKEKARRDFYNFFTFGEWGSSSDYDLCVNSSLLGIEGTADYIIGFGKKAGLIK
mgnify:FL=1